MYSAVTMANYTVYITVILKFAKRVDLRCSHYKEEKG